MVLGIEQGALAVSFVCAGAALMLVAGTQILDWYWLVALALAGLAIGFIRLRKRALTRYAVAQALDQKLALHDTISTAWYVSGRPEIAATPAGQTQLSQAEALAPTVDTARVFPFRGRRAWGVAFALSALAFGLFTVRYLVRHDLDLRQSLVPLHLDRLAAQMRDALTTKDDSARAMDSIEQQTGNSQQAALTEPDDPRMNDVVGLKNPTSAPDREAQAPKSPATGQVPPDSVESSHGDHGKSATGKPNAQEATGNEQPKSSRQEASREQSQPASDQASPGLMDRMKDAMSSLMAKMNPSNSSQAGRQASAHNPEAPDADQNKAQGDPSQMQASSSKTSRSDATAQSKNGKQGQATEMSQSPQSQSSRASNREGGNQSKSGVGSQNGMKDLKEAEELQAMGKLAEIIGKRSQDVTGEMMVEVPSGRQQLRTAYSDQVGHHSDTGGEINRDEVPLMFQQYVREYMERVHRQPSE
jgi:hypothetical protein